jgi:hypothetical protein
VGSISAEKVIFPRLTPGVVPGYGSGTFWPHHRRMTDVRKSTTPLVRVGILRRSKPLSGIALRLKCSVEADVPPSVAWHFRTDIANWDDPPAKFTLDGPFEVGTYGTTELPGQPPLRWQITKVIHGKSFVTDMPLDRAVLAFEWQFDELPGGRTKLTQEIVLSGENAAMYAPQVEAGFGSNLEAGMKRIAAEMAVKSR